MMSKDNTNEDNKNTSKELLYLSYASLFRKRLRHSHPALKTPFLTALNEFGQEKLIITYIKPTLAKMACLSDVRSSVQFVSDRVRLRKTKEKSGPPSLHSPSATRRSQMGNSIEQCNLALCLLRGLGINAFVAVCHTDMGDTSSIEMNLDKLKEKQHQEETVKFASKKYFWPKEHVLKSKFEMREADLHSSNNEASSTKNTINTTVKSSEHHALLYIEEDEESYFVEVTTNQCLSEAALGSMLCMWNENNYWINPDSSKASQRHRWLSLITLDTEEDVTKHVLRKPIYDWTPSLIIDQMTLDKKPFYDGKSRSITYKNARHTRYAMMESGLIESIECESGQKQIFANRADLMNSNFAKMGENIEYFDRGRSDRLHILRTRSNIDDKNFLEANFYSEERIDRLQKRLVQEDYIIDVYKEGRDDKLIYFEVRFECNKGANKSLPTVVTTDENNDENNEQHGKVMSNDRSLIRIIEKFSAEQKESTKSSLFMGPVIDLSQMALLNFDMVNNVISVQLAREKNVSIATSLVFKIANPLDPKFMEETNNVEMVDNLGDEDEVNFEPADPSTRLISDTELDIVYKRVCSERSKAIKRVHHILKEISALREQRASERLNNALLVPQFEAIRDKAVLQCREDRLEQQRRRRLELVDLNLNIYRAYGEDSLDKPNGEELQRCKGDLESRLQRVENAKIEDDDEDFDSDEKAEERRRVRELARRELVRRMENRVKHMLSFIP